MRPALVTTTPSRITPPPRDHVFLRAAFALALTARSRGEEPFGAVLVNTVGEIVGWGESSRFSHGDRFGHAELNVLRQVARHHSVEMLGTMTLYTAVEPCVMCCGAIWISGIRRVVYGIDRRRLVELLHAQTPDLSLTCRDVLASAAQPLEIQGPVLEDEAEYVVIHEESSP
jgi:tRNA(Arg) A34 adenosine deaminase TadA